MYKGEVLGKEMKPKTEQDVVSHVAQRTRGRGDNLCVYEKMVLSLKGLNTTIVTIKSIITFEDKLLTSFLVTYKLVAKLLHSKLYRKPNKSYLRKQLTTLERKISL